MPIFTLFPKLPAEVQFKIWGFALSGPYIFQHKGLRAIFFRCASPLPVLHTCQTSREVDFAIFNRAVANSCALYLDNGEEQKGLNYATRKQMKSTADQIAWRKENGPVYGPSPELIFISRGEVGSSLAYMYKEIVSFLLDDLKRCQMVRLWPQVSNPPLSYL